MPSPTTVPRRWPPAGRIQRDLHTRLSIGDELRPRRRQVGDKTSGPAALAHCWPWLPVTLEFVPVALGCSWESCAVRPIVFLAQRREEPGPVRSSALSPKTTLPSAASRIRSTPPQFRISATIRVRARSTIGFRNSSFSFEIRPPGPQLVWTNVSRSPPPFAGAPDSAHPAWLR